MVLFGLLIAGTLAFLGFWFVLSHKQGNNA
jgi:hypothetical protein